MRTGLVMDASCDLPQAFVNQHHITVLPIHVDVDGEEFDDHRDEGEIQRFIDEQSGVRHHAAATEPCSAEAIQNLFLGDLVARFDCVFCLTVSASRSPTHANATQASFSILKNYRSVRELAGQQGPFLLRVVDTQSLFAGSAVVVAEAVRLIAEGQGPAQIRERLTDISHDTYGYLLPRDLHQLRAQARKKGDHSVGLIGATLGSALDIKPILRGWRGETQAVAKMRGFDAGAEALFRHTAERIRAGLRTPFVAMSYGGPLVEMRALPGYAQVPEACTECGLQLLESPMSITGMASVGEGALAVGFASSEYTPTF
ncbi:MAG TPA: DegV family protein [Rhodanobacteraceae bacterium]